MHYIFCSALEFPSNFISIPVSFLPAALPFISPHVRSCHSQALICLSQGWIICSCVVPTGLQCHAGLPRCAGLLAESHARKRSLNNPESWWKRAVTAGNMSSPHAGTGKLNRAVYHTHGRIGDFYQLQLVTSRSRNLHYSKVCLTIYSNRHAANAASPQILLICRLYLI